MPPLFPPLPLPPRREWKFHLYRCQNYETICCVYQLVGVDRPVPHRSAYLLVRSASQPIYQIFPVDSLHIIIILIFFPVARCSPPPQNRFQQKPPRWGCHGCRCFRMPYLATMYNDNKSTSNTKKKNEGDKWAFIIAQSKWGWRLCREPSARVLLCGASVEYAPHSSVCLRFMYVHRCRSVSPLSFIFLYFCYAPKSSFSLFLSLFPSPTHHSHPPRLSLLTS